PLSSSTLGSTNGPREAVTSPLSPAHTGGGAHPRPAGDPRPSPYRHGTCVPPRHLRTVTALACHHGTCEPSRPVYLPLLRPTAVVAVNCRGDVPGVTHGIGRLSQHLFTDAAVARTRGRYTYRDRVDVPCQRRMTVTASTYRGGAQWP